MANRRPPAPDVATRCRRPDPSRPNDRPIHPSRTTCQLPSDTSNLVPGRKTAFERPLVRHEGTLQASGRRIIWFERRTNLIACCASAARAEVLLSVDAGRNSPPPARRKWLQHLGRRRTGRHAMPRTRPRLGRGSATSTEGRRRPRARRAPASPISRNSLRCGRL